MLEILEIGGRCTSEMEGVWISCLTLKKLDKKFVLNLNSKLKQNINYGFRRRALTQKRVLSQIKINQKQI